MSNDKTNTNVAYMNKVSLNKEDLLDEIEFEVGTWFVDFARNTKPLADGQDELKWLRSIGQQLLKEKQEQQELENAAMGNKLGRKRVAERISNEEAAYILLYLLDWAKISLTGTGREAALAVYKTYGKDKGIYSTDAEYQDQLVDRVGLRFDTRATKETLVKITNTIRNVVRTQTSKKTNTLVPVGNGIFNTETKELHPFSPEYVFTSKVQVDYKPLAQNPVITMKDGVNWDVVSWIKDLADSDKNTELLFWQVISAWVNPSRNLGKSIWLVSDVGNNGKGTFGEILKSLAGEGNYSTLNASQFGDEFMTEALIGKVGNIADENPVGGYIDNAAKWKSYVTGDDMNINRKYQKAISIKAQGLDVQMMNGLPRIKDKTDSFVRRLMLIPFTKSFTNNGERREIKSDYVKRTDVLEFVLKQALNLDFEEFVKTQRSEDAIAEFQESNNPVLTFMKEHTDVFVWNDVPTQFMYDTYTVWFSRTRPGQKPLGLTNFNRELTQLITSGQITGWSDKPKQKRTTKKDPATGKTVLAIMVEDEPLITEYNLVNYLNKEKLGFSNVKQARNFKRKDREMVWSRV